MRARWTVVIALMAVGVLMALPAFAQSDGEDLDPADRVLVHGYDPAAMQLLWSEMMGNSDTAEEECNLTEGEYEYEVDEISGDVSITPVVDEGDDPADPVELGDCQLNTTDVEGPQGQVNHGTVVSNFVQDLKEYLDEAGYEGGIGCYVRIIAQSDYGKGEQQVRVSDVDPGADPVDKTEGQVGLAVSETSCNGWSDDGEGEVSSSGRPDHAGKPDHAGPPEDRGNGKGGPPAHAQDKGKGKSGR